LQSHGGSSGSDFDALVRAITEQVLAALGK